MIELKNVGYSYEDAEALKDINITINKGEAVALVGANGSGKSSLMKLINGIMFPDKGVFLFNGQEINSKIMNNNNFSKSFHQKMGFVFQNSEAQLFCPIVYEEIAFGPTQMGLAQKDIEKRVDDCMKLLNIEHLKHRAPYNLSGGEKKRVAIASVLSLNPDVLILDEPMNGLDPKTKRFLRDLIIKLNKAGKTIICSTHDFEYVEGIFKRAVLFSESHEIVEDDDYLKIINNEILLKKYNIK
jgi:cobalt/nickel transport system ATP-binding protein